MSQVSTAGHRESTGSNAAGGRRHPRRSAAVGNAPPWLQVFVVVLGLAVLAAAGFLAGKAKMLVGPDERANVSYVQIIVDQHRLPVQDRDCISESLHLLQPASPFAPCAVGPGSSYEAFQPPLYYLIAAPVFAAVPGLGNKVYALRALDVLLLATAMAALGWLAYETLDEDWMYGLALGLCAFAVPAVVAEQVPVSNDALVLPLVILVLAACTRAVRHPHELRPLVLAMLLFAAALLTKLTTVYLAVPIAVMVLYRLWYRRRRGWIDVALAVLIPLVLLAPWIADNEKRYHALTADHLAEVQQAPILNPFHERITWTETAAIDRTIVASYLPKLCGLAQPDAPGEPLRDPVSYLFLALILLGPVALALRREGLRGAFTLVPLGAGIFTLDFAFVTAQQPLDDLARYLHPLLAPFGVGVALLIAGRRRKYVCWAGYLAVIIAVGVAVYWIARALPNGAVCTQRIIG